MLLESDEYQFLFDVGCSVPATTVELWDRDRIVQTLANYYTVVSAKVQIDQLVSGLDTLGVIDLLRANPSRGRELYIHLQAHDSRRHNNPIPTEPLPSGVQQKGGGGGSCHFVDTLYSSN